MHLHSPQGLVDILLSYTQLNLGMSTRDHAIKSNYSRKNNVLTQRLGCQRGAGLMRAKLDVFMLKGSMSHVNPLHIVPFSINTSYCSFNYLYI